MNIFAKRFRNRRRLTFIAVLLMVLVAPLSDATRAQTGLLDESRGVLAVAPAIEIAAPAIVNFSVRTHVPGADNPLYRDPAFRRFFGLPEAPPGRELLSAGSGVIVDAQKGYVLTNHHVIDNTTDITVRLRDGRQFNAKRIGSERKCC